MIVDMFREARPRQWMKNVLVLAAPGASGALGDVDVLGSVIVIFVAFCLASSGTYFWNDVRDIEQDRLHPRKSRRPVAAGRIGIPLASATGSILVVCGPALAMTVDLRAALVVACYVVLTLTYSVWWKHVALTDLAVVASGFVLRAVSGAVATDTPMSDWFILCTMFGSLFVVAGKRYAETLEMGSKAGTTRRSLLVYPPGFLAQLLTLSCGATMLSYCLWALEGSNSATADIPLHTVSIVPMCLALLRYMMVLHEGRGSAPEDVFLGDRPIQVYGVLWFLVYAAAVASG